MSVDTVVALKPRVRRALNVASSLLAPQARKDLQRSILLELSLDLGLTPSPFMDPLIPPSPSLSCESNNSDVVRCLAAELDQVTFPTAFKSLYVALASLGTANYHYLQDANYAAHHGIYNYMERAWDQLHPTQISLAPFPVDIPPTPSSHAGSLVDLDQDMDDESHKHMPTPRPLEKGKMCAVDPITPSPLPAPSPAPIELVAPAAAADTAAAPAAGKKKGKKAASLASVAAKAASKPGRVEPPRQQQKITQHF